jgi:hypothetical protein
MHELPEGVAATVKATNREPRRKPKKARQKNFLRIYRQMLPGPNLGGMVAPATD